MMHRPLVFLLLLLLSPLIGATPCIQRRKVVQTFNVHRNHSSDVTPLQVGNGNFAFGADVTGLQTFNPFAILSNFGWHNFSLPTTPGQTEPSDFTGLQWWTHGRLVDYDQPNPAEEDISNWLIKNPQRINLGRIGFYFGDASNVTESDLEQTSQVLDLWSGKIQSSFLYNGSRVEVETSADPSSDVVGISVNSELLSTGDLGIFFDFPYSDLEKFNAPYVGLFNETSKHTTILQNPGGSQVQIEHIMDSNHYYMTAQWQGPGNVSGPLPGTHRYVLKVPGTSKLELTAAFSPCPKCGAPSAQDVTSAAANWWSSYWSSGAFIDLTATSHPNATALQKRIILSQYLCTVNSASHFPPQESGLVNDGWYGKFHLEMYLWHDIHFARWNHFDLLARSTPGSYEKFLKSSYDRAAHQGYKGARWGKMTDPTGRSAPGEINSLLIWQQPHPMYFAEVEYRSFPGNATLQKWDEILTASADFMASFAFWNESTGVYDLGPPMYPVSENTNPNATINPTFELAYWRFGLDIAKRWKERQGQQAPAEWSHVADNLAPLPVVDGAYAVYEGIPDMWTSNETTYDHPAMAGIYGLLPPPLSGPPLNMTVVQNTADMINRVWELQDSYGWDFSMLAMNSLRLGNVEQCVAYLLDPIFQFDDAGYPLGGSRVATPYFPNSASLLLATAMMAGGWDESPGPHFPEGWDVKVEGFVPAM